MFIYKHTHTCKYTCVCKNIHSSKRTEAERVQITQDMYQQYEDEIALNPQVYIYTNTHSHTQI